ncbi:MAG: 3'-5' exonuclease [Flavobacteriales bacterium]|nr:3'-5' exonuclease [Flavobacteriales bacterium]
MKLKLSKPIAFFDLETTGVDVAKDRIVEIAVLKIQPNGQKDMKIRRINPEMPIPKEASDIHGITNEDVADCPTFEQFAKSLFLFLQDCDLAGFNSNRFDIPLLVEEFLRCGIRFDIAGRSLVDVQNIFHKMEQRTLSAAYQFYCDKPLENAHSAEADITATFEILEAQLKRYKDLENNIEFLGEFSRRQNFVDLAGRLVYNDDKEAVFNFGKHKGKTVEAVLQAEPSYYAWMMQGDFPLYTKQVLSDLKEKYKG